MTHPGDGPFFCLFEGKQREMEGCGIGLTCCLLPYSGNLRSLNELAKQARADHIIHTGDFGFYDNTSLERIADK